jgi:DNA-binding transcriptional MerR regulator
MDRANDDHEELYPIRTVSSLTGVKPVTLRAWERRYGLIQPDRTHGSHRLYTKDDIEKIYKILALIDKGIPVSKVSDIVNNRPQTSNREKDVWDDFHERMMDAIGTFDHPELKAIYNEAMATQPIAVVTENLILPILKELGERWQENQTGVSEEHFFSFFLRNKLGARFHHSIPPQHGIKILACCLPGERHEIGLLVFALEALANNFRPALLGADTPLEEIPLTVRKAGARAIVFSCTGKDILRNHEDAIRELTEGIDIPVFIGGPVAISQRDIIVRCGAIPLGEQMHAALQKINQLTS